MPLPSLPSSDALLEQRWSAPVMALVIQQVAEPALERRLRDSIPRLTSIDDQVSQAVQRQYEENPYPRWTKAAANRGPISIGEYVQRELQFAGPQHLKTANAGELLVAGCGTGQETIEIALRFPRSRILAIDLSLSSLCYAKRKTTELGLTNVEYAQGDIVALGCVDLNFDVIYSVGVLHHLAEPGAGLKQLYSILRDGGLMRLGLYSERARKTVSSGRTFAEDRGYTATPADIRRCREEIILRGAELGLSGLPGFADFFAMSECRDLLFHVKEHRYTIPALKEMLKALGLQFLGFSVEPETLRRYRERFPRDESSADFDNWNVFEAEHPETFAGMYQFWAYKAANASA
jgi:SAM-dependent methyltransferase